LLKFYFGASAVVVVLLAGTQAPGAKKSMPSLSDSYHDECIESTCKPEEIAELYEDYTEEILESNGSLEELSEIAGGADSIDPMLVAFLDSGPTYGTDRHVLYSSFQSVTGPGTSKVWIYTGCGSANNNTPGSGKLIEIVGSTPTLYSEFVNNVYAIQIGPAVPRINTFHLPNYQNGGYTYTQSDPCLTPPANAIDVQSIAYAPASQ